MRAKFDEQLDLLNSELIMMGGLCEEVIYKAANAMLKGDPVLAREVFPIDSEIDRKEHDIESLCLKLLLQQQPVAKDLRLISAALTRASAVQARFSVLLLWLSAPHRPRLVCPRGLSR